MAPVIGIVVAEDHPVLRWGLLALLAECPDMAVLGEAMTGDEAIALTRAAGPDVLVLDLSLPSLDGFAVLGRLKDDVPPVPVIVHSALEDLEYREAALSAGAAAFVGKSAPPDRLLAAIRDVGAWRSRACELR